MQQHLYIAITCLNEPTGSLQKSSLHVLHVVACLIGKHHHGIRMAKVGGIHFLRTVT